METFGDRLLRIIQERNLSKKKLAIICRVKRTQIYQWTTGEHEPTLTNLRKLAEGLEVEIRELTGD